MNRARRPDSRVNISLFHGWWLYRVLSLSHQESRELPKYERRGRNVYKTPDGSGYTAGHAHRILDRIHFPPVVIEFLKATPELTS